MKWVVATFLAVTLQACTAYAKTFVGATFPDTIRVDDKTLTLNGMGLRTLTILKSTPM